MAEQNRAEAARRRGRRRGGAEERLVRREMRGDGEEAEVWRREEQAGEDRRSLGPVEVVDEEERRGSGGEIEGAAVAVAVAVAVVPLRVAKARQATQARCCWSSAHGGVLRGQARRLSEGGGRPWTARRGCSHPIGRQINLVCQLGFRGSMSS